MLTNPQMKSVQRSTSTLTLLSRTLKKLKKKRDLLRRKSLAANWDGMSSLVKAMLTRQTLALVLILEPRRLSQPSQVLLVPFSSREAVVLPLLRNLMLLATKLSSLPLKVAREVRTTINLLKRLPIMIALPAVNSQPLVILVCLLHLLDSRRHPEKNANLRPLCLSLRVRPRLEVVLLWLLSILKKPKLTITTLVSWYAM
mmetsp:Transcript_77968/g.107781  ORF Transcript_77968/g.107781 Transcript_77968/m.107781 type:complete len:200 (+) Transcript_77968:300-899(+)